MPRCMRWLEIGLCLAVCPIAAAVGTPSDNQVRRLSIRYTTEKLRRTDAPSCFIIKLKDGTSAEEREKIFQQANGTNGETWGNALNGFLHCDTPDHHLEWLATHPSVEAIEEDSKVKVALTQQVEVLTQTGQWGLDRIDQRTKTYDSRYYYGYTGSGVTAYVVDTGILSTHQEFTGRVGTGYVVPAIGTTTTDCNGHGTHVSGILGGSSVGVAKGVTLIPVRSLDCSGEGTVSNIISALNWVVTQTARPAVINLSLGGGSSTTLDTVVQGAVAAGFLVVVAAGNDAVDACTDSPGRVSTSMTAGATDSTDTMSSFSNYGSCVKIFAPGSSIYSSWYTSTSTYALLSGTSMACPFVAGTYALYLEENSSITPADMMTYTQSVATSGVISSLGSGSPNLLLYSLGNSTPNSSATVQSPNPTGSSSSSSSSGSNTWLWGLFGLLGLVFLLAALLFAWCLHLRHRKRRRNESPPSYNPEAPSWDVYPGGMTPAPTPTPAGAV